VAARHNRRLQVRVPCTLCKQTLLHAERAPGRINGFRELVWPRAKGAGHRGAAAGGGHAALFENRRLLKIIV
jgi:hypothetical protein